MTVSALALRQTGRRWAAALSLMVPLWANAAASPAVDLMSVITPHDPISVIFDPESPAYEAVQFFGAGVVKAPGSLTAPVKTQWVDGVEGQGGFEVSWGQDSGLVMNGDFGIRATDFLLSLVDNRLYVDVEVRDFEGQVHVLDNLAMFHLENVQGSAVGSSDGQQSLLGLSGDLYLDFEGTYLLLSTLYPDVTPPDATLTPVLVARLEVGAIPEPATWATMALGLAGVMGMARRGRGVRRVS